ncbi:drug resistance transporter, EmrB/QacA subfamily [Paenibacillaceae bacterium GAS479]|nr:drug resistance transporter, EmrB/QacA subfamily [Paenibacillaceae bacterium GAS479]
MKKHSILFAVLLGAFSLVLTNSAFNILLPSLVTLYSISTSLGGWLMALYILAMTITMPLTSLFVDRFGRKRTYLFGLALYGLTSGIGALFSHSFEVAMLVRLLHGIAAGLMIPLSLVLLFDYYGNEARGRVVGAWGMLLTIAPAIGPTLGGVIIQYGDLSALFWINVPFAVAAFVWCSFKISAYPPVRRKTIHWQSLTLLVLGVALFSLGIQFVSQPGVPAWGAAALLLLGAAAGIQFLRVESKKEEPLIRFGLLKRYPVYTAALVVAAVQDAVMFGVIFVLPLFFQEALNLSPAVAGAMFIPTAIATSLFAWIGGSLVDAGKSRGFIGYGIFFVALSIVSFAFLPQTAPLVLVMALMALRGIGNGLSEMSLTTIGFAALPEEDLHEGSALANTLQRLASSFTVMLLAVYYDFRKGMLIDAGQLADNAGWMALKEECLLLGALLLLTLPLLRAIKLKRVNDVAGEQAA